MLVNSFSWFFCQETSFIVHPRYHISGYRTVFSIMKDLDLIVLVIIMMIVDVDICAWQVEESVQLTVR